MKIYPKWVRDLKVKCLSHKYCRYVDDLEIDDYLDRMPKVQYMKEAMRWTLLKLNILRPGVVLQFYNPSANKTEARGVWGTGHVWLHSESLLQKEKKNKTKVFGYQQTIAERKYLQKIYLIKNS